MKTLFLTTVLLMVFMGWGVYVASQYKAPDFPIPSSEAILSPTVSITPYPLPFSAPAVINLDTPYGLSVKIVSPIQANLSWHAPNNTTGVSGYMIYKNNIRIGISINTLYSDPDYSSQSDNSYSVVAYNQQGSISASSNIAFVAKNGNVALIPPTPTPIPGAPTPTPIPGGPPTPTPTPLPIPTRTPTPIPTPVPTPPPSSCGSGGPCTAAQIATHNTASNCWVYLTTNSKVYNITGYISSGTHPAGSSVIAPACGKDMTPYFITGAIGGHRHSTSALNSVLAAYYIGPFQ